MSAALRLLWPDEEPRPPIPVPKKKKHRDKLPNFLREAEAENLLQTCRVQAQKTACPSKMRAAARDEIVVHLGLFLGLRVSEMRNLEIPHLDLVRLSCFVCEGKGQKDRYVQIPDWLAGPLKDWIGERTSGLMLTTERGKKMTNMAIQSRMARLGKLAGLSRKLKPHTLRHTYAVRLIENGAAIHEVKDLLGHENIAVTSVYLKCTPERLRSAVNRLRKQN